jgi:hypothetical protein
MAKYFFPQTGRGRIDHVWLPVDRFDDRLGSNAIAALVVAG